MNLLYYETYHYVNLRIFHFNFLIAGKNRENGNMIQQANSCIWYVIHQYTK